VLRNLEMTSDLISLKASLPQSLKASEPPLLGGGVNVIEVDRVVA